MKDTILQVTMWKRDHDGKWSVCVLSTGAHAGHVRREKRTFDSFTLALVWVSELRE